MKYLLLICTEGAFDPADHPRRDLDASPWVEEMTRRGVRLTGNRVRAASDATTVRVRGDETLVTDGPFAETKEQMGGLTLIECADRAEALRVASTHPWATTGMIEVRQVLG